MKKIRLDQYLVESKLVDDINIARSLIIQGKVYVNQQQNTKPGTGISTDTRDIIIKRPIHDYVSRGALKLIAALDPFQY